MHERRDGGAATRESDAGQPRASDHTQTRRTETQRAKRLTKFAGGCEESDWAALTGACLSLSARSPTRPLHAVKGVSPCAKNHL